MMFFSLVALPVHSFALKTTKELKIPDITPDPGGHRPQRPRAQGRTCPQTFGKTPTLSNDVPEEQRHVFVHLV